MDIKSLAEQYNDYIIDRRRYYHTCPELSGEEKNTRAHLKEDLEALGITDIHELETCYGLTATIHGGKPGKTVALRADIDALPVKEETGLPFASHNEGKMHACGHDNHMAMLLGAAKILNEVKEELSGDVRLVFQPAEETAVGALQMMKEHAPFTVCMSGAPMTLRASLSPPATSWPAATASPLRWRASPLMLPLLTRAWTL